MNLNNRLLGTVVAAAALTNLALAVGGGAAHADSGVRLPAVAAATALPFATHPTTAAVTDGGSIVAAKPPTAPRSPAAIPGNTTVTLYWSKPASNGGAAINKYAVQRARAGGAWKTIAFPTIRSYTAKGLVNGVRYYFRVRAHNAAGWGPYGTAVNAVPRKVPTAPRSPAAAPSNARVKLTWLKPLSNGGVVIDHYAVKRYDTATKQWKIIAKPTGTSYTAKGLTNGTKYSFRILAHNAAGYGPASTTVSATPHITAPGVPRSVLATPGDSIVQMSWQAPSTDGGSVVDTYQIELSYDKQAWYVQAATSSLGKQIGPVVPGTTYYFRVRAHNDAGWGLPSAPVTAVPFTVPTAPQSCKASKFGQQSIWAEWSPPASDGYSPIVKYFITAWSGGSFKAAQKVAADVNAFYVTGLDLANSYDVRVSALNQAGEGTWCEVHVP
jgi:hypothetical protein